MSSVARDYTVFDAELAGKAFDARLLRRLFQWIRPHWREALWSGLLVIAASVLAILMPVIVTRVVVPPVSVVVVSRARMPVHFQRWPHQPGQQTSVGAAGHRERR